MSYKTLHLSQPDSTFELMTPRPGPISIKKGPNVDMDESILSDNWTRPRTYMLSGSNVFFFSNTVEVVYYISNNDTVAKEQKHRH